MSNLDLSREASRLDALLNAMPGVDESVRAEVYATVAASSWSPADPYAHWIAIGVIMRRAGVDVAGELDRFPDAVRASVKDALNTILGPVVQTAKAEVEKAIVARQGELDKSAASMRNTIKGEAAASMQSLERKAAELLTDTYKGNEARANAVLGGKAIGAAVALVLLMILGAVFLWNSAYGAGRSATAGYAAEVAQWATRSDWPTIAGMTRQIDINSAIANWCGAGSPYRRVLSDKDYCGPFPLNGVAVAGEGVSDLGGLWRVLNGAFSSFPPIITGLGFAAAALVMSWLWRRRKVA